MLTARSAVSLTRPDGNEPVFGAAWFSAHIITDRDSRTVTLRDVTVKGVRLPGSTAAEQQDFARAINGRLSAAEITFPLDQLTASVDTVRQEETAVSHNRNRAPAYSHQHHARHTCLHQWRAQAHVRRRALRRIARRQHALYLASQRRLAPVLPQGRSTLGNRLGTIRPMGRYHHRSAFN